MATFIDERRLVLRHRKVTAENINELIAEAGFSGEIDLLAAALSNARSNARRGTALPDRRIEIDGSTVPTSFDALRRVAHADIVARSA
jgi:hypothetical protein